MCFGHEKNSYYLFSQKTFANGRELFKNMQNTDIQYLSQVQKTLSQNPNASQRELASSTNLSLGMTNALLKRYSDKGWLYMKKISARNVKYILTPEGMNKIIERSRQSFHRTASLMKTYKETICNVIENSDCEKVYLVGETDLEFLFDFACAKNHIVFQKVSVLPNIEKTALIVFTSQEQYNECGIERSCFIEDILRKCAYETM